VIDSSPSSKTVEREVVVGLLRQTHEFLAPTHREPTGDPFDDLVARLGLPALDDSGAGVRR
jgi:hypothetical protein